MFNKDCKVCNGVGSYNIPNHHLEIMEKIECIDCSLEVQFKDDLKERLTRLLTTTSREKLAQIVSEMVVNGVDITPQDDLNRIEGIVHTKNKVAALALGLAYSNQ